jgi:MFS transporter, BCD family, chlorophyll transporter
MFAVAAIGSMMALAGEGRGRREGTRMGLWGAAQAIAAGFRRADGARPSISCALASPMTPGLRIGLRCRGVFFSSPLLMAARIMDRRAARSTQLVPGE